MLSCTLYDCVSLAVMIVVSCSGPFFQAIGKDIKCTVLHGETGPRTQQLMS